MKFQSHIGAIRISNSPPSCSISSYFNPTLVQLECYKNELYSPTLVLFQSHIGAIRM